MADSTLYARTMRLIEQTKFNEREMCAALGVTTRWLGYLKAGEIKDPGVHKVQAVHDYLADRQQPDGRAA